ncbi:MAG: hypothetical protein WKG07_15385 [Hymenobacter sp.]
MFLPLRALPCPRFHGSRWCETSGCSGQPATKYPVTESYALRAAE